MQYQDILYEVQNGAAFLTLNRPEKLNALTWHSWSEVAHAVEQADADDNVRVLVITGAGAGFCSGNDVTNIGQRRQSEDGNRSRQTRSRFSPVPDLMASQKPSIAAVNGVAAGSGLALCLACDIRIASTEACFIAAWSRRALVPDFGATFLLPRVIGMEQAMSMVYTGDPVGARTALEMGLVSKLADPSELMAHANGLAARIASGPPLAMEMTKRLMYRSWLRELNDQIWLEDGFQSICVRSEDFQEGVRSFLEKRSPQFKGR